MQFYKNLSPREQKTVIFGGIALAIILFYFLFLEPLQAEKEQLSKIVSSQQVSLQWMQQAVAEIKAQQAQGTSTQRALNGSLSVVVDNSLRSSTLASKDKRIEPEGDKKVRVHFEQVGFMALMRWLVDIYSRYTIQVQSIVLEKNDQPDNVRARIVLVHV